MVNSGAVARPWTHHTVPLERNIQQHCGKELKSGSASFIRLHGTATELLSLPQQSHMLLSLNNIVGGKWTRGTIKHVDAGTTNM
jgi:hypothetical protein